MRADKGQGKRASEDNKGVGNDPHGWPGGKQCTRADTGGDMGESEDAHRREVGQVRMARMASENEDAQGCTQMKGGRGRTRTRMSVVPIGASHPWSRRGAVGVDIAPVGFWGGGRRMTRIKSGVQTQM